MKTGSNPRSGTRALARALLRVFEDKHRRALRRRDADGRDRMPKKTLIEVLERLRETRRRKEGAGG
jgi:hypothetical protein